MLVLQLLYLPNQFVFAHLKNAYTNKPLRGRQGEAGGEADSTGLLSFWTYPVQPVDYIYIWTAKSGLAVSSHTTNCCRLKIIGNLGQEC